MAVLSGIEPESGASVITNGTYLLNSDAVFKHGTQMQMNMPGMDMSSHQHE